MSWNRQQYWCAHLFLMFSCWLCKHCSGLSTQSHLFCDKLICIYLHTIGLDSAEQCFVVRLNISLVNALMTQSSTQHFLCYYYERQDNQFHHNDISTYTTKKNKQCDTTSHFSVPHRPSSKTQTETLSYLNIPWQWKVLVQPYSKIWPMSNWACASQMHLCITNGWRPAQLNKALSGRRMTLCLVNISVSLNNADCHLPLILLLVLSCSLHLPSQWTVFASYTSVFSSSHHLPSPFSPWLRHLPQSVLRVFIFLPLHHSPHTQTHTPRTLTTSPESQWFWRWGSSTSFCFDLQLSFLFST